MEVFWAIEGVDHPLHLIKVYWYFINSTNSILNFHLVSEKKFYRLGEKSKIYFKIFFQLKKNRRKQVQ